MKSVKNFLFNGIEIGSMVITGSTKNVIRYNLFVQAVESTIITNDLISLKYLNIYQKYIRYFTFLINMDSIK
jgi:hypothetical protein